MVSDLIDVEKKSWDVDILNQVFLPFEVEIIEGIPLSNRLPVDKQIWSKTANGIFSVRSAYKIALEMQKANVGGSVLDGGSLRAFWKKLWKFQVPNKVRHFVWRAAKDTLPTKTNLVKRHVIVDDLCEECGLYAESLFHVSMECPKAREPWGFTQFSHLLSSMNFQSSMDFLWYIVMVAKWSNADVALAVTIVWALWTNRNETNHGGMRKFANQIFQWCIQYLEEYWSACTLPMKKTSAAKKNWVPPTGLNYKVNVDGAVFSAQKSVGLGVVIRHNEGHFIAGLGKKLNLPLGAIETEAKAFKIGIAFAGEIGILFWKVTLLL
ncbi:hypothetical protein SO802_026004 [Lithocarpus litseifolius]|uniref:Reverse transcriptase zinc-binding domain-containing protein n=1 Tax=Lithocarpus litseifolius TaxID=425828 RepID=A0AAW2C1Q2_9ROSI